jgi:hypothetical protein
MWGAMLAKLVAPLEPERAAKAIAPMLANLGRYPDAAFTVESVQMICRTGRILPDGSEAPLNRVPTFGELDLALDKWWRGQCEMAAIRALPAVRVALPPPPAPPEEWTPEAAKHVQVLVKAFEGERTWHAPGPHRNEALPVKPVYLSDGHLLALYEGMAAQGMPGAAARLRAIRDRMAAAAGATDRPSPPSTATSP